ncbi:MAG: tetratricopeptide repeat protein [Rhodospirillaceae bacterium]|nr:tetratricopeptide repeat protein [Rhodospirillaceae bacterium]
MSGSFDGPAADIMHVALRAFEAGKFDGAAIGFETVLADDPDNAEALYFLSVIRYQQGQNDDALPLAERAATARPESEDCHNLLGLVLIALERPQDAIAQLTRAISCNREFPDAYNNLGAACEADGDFDSAADFFRRATAIDPRYVQGYSNLARILLATGQPAEAESACLAALSIQADFPDARFNLAISQQRQGKLEDAEMTVEAALAKTPDSADLWRFLGILRQSRGDLSGAEAALRAAIERQPQLAEAHDNLAGILLDQGLAEAAEASFKRALEIDPGDRRAHSNLLMCRNYTETNADRLLAEHKAWATQHPQKARVHPARPGRTRIRVGYVSGDFRRHSVAFFFEPMLRFRDASRFETFCYANMENPDDVTSRMQDLADNWRWVAGLDDDKLEALIRTDEIDILIDLSGHTAGNRLPVFQRKPAPLQASWLGYPNTTGLESIDFRITDDIADPENAAPQATETLLRLNGGFLSYTPPGVTPAVAPLPADPIGFITFGSFNNRSKMSQQTIEDWAQILAARQDAKRLIKARPLADPAVAQHYLSVFEEQGIETDRLIFRASLASPTEHLAAYSQIDIALDPFPYNGTTTSCEALWMGVPVLTLRGNRHASRVGASLLTQIGHEDWICDTLAAYIGTAKTLASDWQNLARIRQSLRDRMASSPLCDGRDFCHRLENTLLKVLERADC